MSNKIEIWKATQFDYVEASTHGHVRKHGILLDEIMDPESGYLYVQISDDLFYWVGQLIAETFLAPPSEGNININ